MSSVNILIIIVTVVVGFPYPVSTAISASWFDSDAVGCNQTGVKCDGPRVTQLDMSIPCSLSSPLNIPFPCLIAEFTSLQQLNLTGCGFTGHICPDFWNLDKLEALDLTSNKLSGHVPPSIARMKNLRVFILDNNLFSGRLPREMGDLLQLRELSLHSNSFSGILPEELGNLSLMQSIDISNNMFSGSLPPSLANLTKLSYFTARHNAFSGDLFREIGDMKGLVIVDLSWNSLRGLIPSTVGDLKELSYFNIAHNHFDGEFPASIGRLGNLAYLMASNSGLKGEIPSQLGNCTNLKALDLSYNSLHGPLPDQLAELRSVQSILLNSNRLSGPIPLWISNWKSVASVILSENLFNGPLPPLDLPSLQHFDVSANMLSGELSADICNAPLLTTLILSRNSFSGGLDAVFKNCFNLRDLILSENHISGELPGYLGKLRLTTLELAMNNLSGLIPDGIWESKTLVAISLNNNSLHGSLPAAVANLTMLHRLQLDNNLLGGGIPTSIGKLKNLTNLSIHGNKLIGDIPSQIFECTKLVSLDLGGNRLTGQIVKAISKLQLLDNLVLSDNRLSGTIPQEICSGFQKVPLPDTEFTQHYGMLDLSYNQLEGPLPPTIRNCIVVKEIHLQGNKLSGSIPEEIWSLPNLTSLDLSFNSFSTWVVPPTTSLLQGITLSHNQLRGSIPDNIWLELPSLAKLDLSNNYLSGPLPSSLFNATSLAYLDVSMNSLSGRLTMSSSSSSLLVLNASNNQMSGLLDDSIRNMVSLSMLDLHNNALSGAIPPSLSSLDRLTYLDLSGNRFQDSFPCNICSIQGLAYTSFSRNKGDFPNSCKDKKPCHSLSTPVRPHDSVFGVYVTISAAVISVIMFVVVVNWNSQRQEDIIVLGKPNSRPTCTEGKKREEPLSINLATFEHSLLRLEAADIASATENFSRSYIIGDGGFGTVYKAELAGGRTIAVKRLNGGKLREFLAEIETIGKVRHENLVPLLGYCVVGDERFLIYEYMENGSLDLWLRRGSLDWPTRFKICLGSARGIAFLHHGFVPHIIHRDIKSSNILLDSGFEPRVSDFGLARIISACESHISTELAGTFGYIPPEYGQAMVATTKGDVYSFGVVMLELVTGRTPIGQADGEGGNLVGWVGLMVGDGREDQILDACFCGVAAWKYQMLRVLSVARSCTNEKPWMRPSMLEVVKLLKQAINT